MAGFEGLGGAVGGLIGMLTAGDSGRKQYREAIQAWRALEEADFDLARLTPPQLQVVAEVFPELTNAQVPTTAPTIEDSPELRDAQLRALGGVEDVAGEGMPLVDRIAAQRASEAVMRAGRSGTEAALAELAARGRLSGGDEIAARALQGSYGANLASELGGQLASDAALRRLAAATQAGTMAGSIRGQDVATSAEQANLAQRFNEMVYAILNANEQANAQRAQEASLWNAANRQNVANQNPLLRYQGEEANLNRTNQLLQNLWGQQYAQTQGLTGALQARGDQQAAMDRARAQGWTNIGQGVGGLVDTVYGIGEDKNNSSGWLGLFGG